MSAVRELLLRLAGQRGDGELVLRVPLRSIREAGGLVLGEWSLELGELRTRGQTAEQAMQDVAALLGPVG